MPADIIIYAVVAAGLVFWLRSILGTRHGEERERPNPFSQPDEAVKPPSKEQPHPPEEKGESAEEIIKALGKSPGSIYAVENKTAENGLLDIAEKDKAFDVQFFMTGAQEAFTLIVEAFASGDLETLEGLLSEDVYRAFSNAIQTREEAGQSMETRIHGLRKVEIQDVHEEGSMAFITVRFVADETTVLKDKDGTIIEGDPEEVTEMVDIWTFGKDIRSEDPRWLVYQTNSDDPDDNETIPNTH